VHLTKRLDVAGAAERGPRRLPRRFVEAREREVGCVSVRETALSALHVRFTTALAARSPSLLSGRQSRGSDAVRAGAGATDYLASFVRTDGIRSRAIRRFDEPHPLAGLTIRLDEDDTPRLERAADGRSGGALQGMLSALEAADGATADLRSFGEFFLGPVEQGSGGPTLRWRKGHGREDKGFKQQTQD
jgi:hypothetical protein